MAQPKRVKSNRKGEKKQVAAKQSIKKKQKVSSKHRNDELREALDRQTHDLYNTSKTLEKQPLIVSPQAVEDLAGSLSSL